MLGRFSLVKLNEELTPFITKVPVSSQKNIVLFLGKTGAGKSTTVNYLLGYQLKRIRGGHAYSRDPKVTLPAEMGDKMEAITTFPSVYEVKDKKESLCDCPGFEDTRGLEMRVTTALSMQWTVDKAKNIAAMVVVIDYRMFTSDRANALRTIALTLGQLLDRPLQMANSILFVFNRMEQDVEKSDLLKVINEVIQLEQRKLEKLTPGLNTFAPSESKDKDESSRMLNLLRLIVSVNDI